MKKNRDLEKVPFARNIQIAQTLPHPSRQKMPLLKMDGGQSSIHPAAGWLFFNLAHLKGVSQLSAEGPTILVRWS